MADQIYILGSIEVPDRDSVTSRTDIRSAGVKNHEHTSCLLEHNLKMSEKLLVARVSNRG